MSDTKERKSPSFYLLFKGRNNSLYYLNIGADSLCYRCLQNLTKKLSHPHKKAFHAQRAIYELRKRQDTADRSRQTGKGIQEIMADVMDAGGYLARQ